MNADEALRYWRERLAGVTQPTRLGVERPAAGGGERGRARLPWTAGRVSELERAAAAAGRRPEHLLLAAVGLLIAAHAGEPDVVHGVLPDGSGGEPWPMRVRVDPLQPLAAHLDDVRDGWEGGTAHAGPTPAELAACAGLADGVALFGTVVRVTRCAPDPTGSAYDIALTVALGPEAGLHLDHAHGLLGGVDADRLLTHLDRIVSRLVDAADGDPVGDLGPLSDAELAQLLGEWNDTARDLGEPRCLHELFELQAARTPDALAVVQGADRLSYAELDAAADRLAVRLAAAGVGRGDTVALHLRRTVRMVVALLGVLKAGAAYAPVDPALPAERVRELVGTLAAPVVLSDPDAVPEVLRRCAGLPALRAALWLGGDGQPPAGTAPEGMVVGDALAAPAAGAPGPDRAHPDDPAYTIFTSGSTGRPKGVAVAHAPAVNLIRWVNETYRVGPADQVLCTASLSFDLSVYDIFGLLAAGGSIRVASTEELRDPQRLLAILDDEPVTFWDSAPAALQQLEPFFALREPPAEHSLRLVFLSGDWVPLTLPDAARTAFADPEVVALGGATEAAIWSNHFPVTKVDPDWPSIPYGRPIANARYHVLDAGLRPAPVGAPGDLYIGGDCLATGYHADPRLTAAKFVPDPYGGTPGGRLYRTGDRARFWPDGVIEFLGRQDDQVKIRGFRVELGEVEVNLAALPGVGSAVAAVHGGAPNLHLVAYVVPSSGATVDPAGLRAGLADRLPPYMVPARIVVLDALPVTANGKLDRAALPAPDFADAGGTAYVAPRTPVEEVVAELWAEVLGVERVGAEDGFFDLGGHSMLIPQVLARLTSDLQVTVPPVTVLNHPTLAGFAAVVERALLDQIEAAEVEQSAGAARSAPAPEVGGKEAQGAGHRR
ncbi:non-ribosomal peptide synthetase [Micromonospora mirobrigensis]|uniref:Amino acid adenylation domain-containing protein n=1 Tax=Micromonospora mirobrigensis TaxID=262898 RepID=A0A1C4YWI5_9ACTN|nr:amino acid adenylation domain-containing protein [Micromonospora mirobrigensis]SCF25044.1 amino acid adenylation domain-containing protein [Micromonospora mirobrigensis]